MKRSSHPYPPQVITIVDQSHRHISKVSIVYYYQQNKTRTFSRNDILICVTHGKGYAVHKGIGEKLWRASCPVSLFGAPLSSVFVTGRDSVLVAANGKTTCLDLFTDSTKWTHKMKVGNT